MLTSVAVQAEAEQAPAGAAGAAAVVPGIPALPLLAGGTFPEGLFQPMALQDDALHHFCGDASMGLLDGGLHRGGAPPLPLSPPGLHGGTALSNFGLSGFAGSAGAGDPGTVSSMQQQQQQMRQIQVAQQQEMQVEQDQQLGQQDEAPVEGPQQQQQQQAQAQDEHVTPQAEQAQQAHQQAPASPATSSAGHVEPAPPEPPTGRGQHFSLLTVGGGQAVAGMGEYENRALVVQGGAVITGETTVQGIRVTSGGCCPLPCLAGAPTPGVTAPGCMREATASCG